MLPQTAEQNHLKLTRLASRHVEYSSSPSTLADVSRQPLMWPFSVQQARLLCKVRDSRTPNDWGVEAHHDLGCGKYSNFNSIANFELDAAA